MIQFAYTARNEDGATVRGTLNASSVQAAHAALREMDLSPVELTESGPRTQIPEPKQWNVIEPAPNELVSAAVITAPEEAPVVTVAAPAEDYAPLSDTLRLYAGWLLAWYFIIFALGSYQFTRKLPFTIPLIDELFLSPLILNFACAAFLFLLLSGFHRMLGRRILIGIPLMLVGAALFVLFWSNS